MAVFADLSDKINFFFDSPTGDLAVHKRAGLASVLYLLRRELVETAGYNPVAGDTEETVDRGGVRNRLFASLIVAFTGFDLLAKFQRGDTERGGPRFKQFLRSPDAAGLDAHTSDLLYAARNGLVHAFGVPDADMLAKLGMKGVGYGQRKEGTWGGTHGLLVVERQGEDAIIYVDGVFRTWKDTIGKYRESLFGSNSAGPRAIFERMFDKYGTIRIA